MANQRAKRGTGKNSRAYSAASGAVGTIFNIVLIIVVAMVTYRLSVFAFQYGVRIFGEPPMSEEPGQEVTVTIEDGMDFDGIAQTLYDSGLIRDKGLFRIQELLSNYSEDGFAEGTYTLSTAMTPEELMDTMAGSGEDLQGQ